MTDWTWNFRYFISEVLKNRELNSYFLSELSVQLAKFIEKETGLNPLNLKNFISLSLNHSYHKPFVYNEKISIGELDAVLLADICSFPIVIKWKSKSGKIYTPTSENIDPDDIEFWIEGLEKEKILEVWNDPAYNPKTLGFKHKKTHFELVVEYFHYDAFYLIVFLKEQETNQDDLIEISNEINNIFEQHNIKSEKYNRKYGLIHDFGTEEIKNNKLTYYIDYGSANDKPLKDVIDKLNAFDKIEKVVFTGQKE